MREIYKTNTANYPRLETDTFFADYDNNLHFTGFVDEQIRFIEQFQLLDADQWSRFVRQFKEQTDFRSGWRGEYWGKMMRGAALTYSYTRNPVLYQVMTDTVKDMLTAADETGRISTFDVSHEFRSWDIWCRKYVLLGMQYYLEVCEDTSLANEVIKSMCGQLDYIIDRIGPKQEGKKPITSATNNWRGLNSSSLLEPVVRLYSLTKSQKYLDFAKYIVDGGGTDIVNVFDLAYQNRLQIYQYPVTKAYELTSCFEGLLEYYRITQIEKYKISVINFANKILQNEMTVVGGSGCTHEFFDHAAVRQANTNNHPIKQETCVTVTLMKFFYQLLLLTGDPKYADIFEISMYNAYFGAINSEKVVETSVQEKYPELVFDPMPFDSYSPLTAEPRGKEIGGFQIMPDNHYYGCCACIGPAGNGLIPKMALMSWENGLAVNLYIDGRMETKTPAGKPVAFITETEYPRLGEVKITVHIDQPEVFTLLLRNPAWSTSTVLSVNGEPRSAGFGYMTLEREWKNGDVLCLSLDMRTEAIHPVPYGSQVLMNSVSWAHDYTLPTYDEEDPLAKRHVALRRGPVILAQENRLGYSVDDPVTIDVQDDGYVSVQLPQTDTAPYEHIVEVTVPLQNGEFMTMTDYASAGKLWNEESKMAAWILTEE